MNLFLAALAVFACAMAGMGIGLILGNRRLQGSCGGLAGLRDERGNVRCDACSTPSDECAGIDNAHRRELEANNTQPTGSAASHETVADEVVR